MTEVKLGQYFRSRVSYLQISWCTLLYGKVSHEGVTSFSGSARVIWVGTSIHLNIRALHSYFCFDNLATAECQCFDSSIRLFVKSFENLNRTEISLLNEDFQILGSLRTLNAGAKWTPGPNKVLFVLMEKCMHAYRVTYGPECFDRIWFFSCPSSSIPTSLTY